MLAWTFDQQVERVSQELEQYIRLLEEQDPIELVYDGIKSYGYGKDAERLSQARYKYVDIPHDYGEHVADHWYRMGIDLETVIERPQSFADTITERIKQEIDRYIPPSP